MNEKWNVFKTTMVCVVIFSSIISTMLVVSMAYSPYVILSGSMEPTLHVGDVVMVADDVDYSKINVGQDGDILVIENHSIFVENGVPASFYAHLDGKTPIIHRAIERRVVAGKLYFITKGDNNPYADGCIKYTNWTSPAYSVITINASDPVLVPMECILGIVISVVPFIGNFKIHAGTIYIHVVVVVGIFLVYYLRKRGVIVALKKHLVRLSTNNE